MAAISTLQGKFHKSRKKTWAERSSLRQQTWFEEKSRIINAELLASQITGKCAHCNTDAIIRCYDCNNISLCFACDDHIHLQLPLHNRVCYSAGFLEPLAPGDILDENHVLVDKGIFFTVLYIYL